MIKNKSDRNNELYGLGWSLERALKVPLKECGPRSLSAAYALIPKKILPLLSRFLLRHKLHFKLAFLSAGKFVESCLLLLSADKSGSEPIPGFVLEYIKNLPFCRLFQGFVAPEKKLLFLCEYGFRHPLPLAELVAETSATGLYISFAEGPAANLIIRPLPRLRPASSILQYEVDFPVPRYELAVPPSNPGKISIPLKLVDCRPDSADSSPVVFLEKKEISWLKKMLYRLPGPLFAGIELLGNQDFLFLFFADAVRSEFLPFGQRFRRIAPHIFIPADQDLLPHLETELLTELFQVKEGHYVFLSKTWRRDLPVACKTPLCQLLTVDNDVTIEFYSEPDLNGFVGGGDSVFAEGENVSVSELPPVDNSGVRPAIPVAEQLAETMIKAEECGDSFGLIKKSLNAYAHLLKRQGDFLGAATCFSLAEASLAAADCYAEAARALTSK